MCSAFPPAMFYSSGFKVRCVRVEALAGGGRLTDPGTQRGRRPSAFPPVMFYSSGFKVSLRITLNLGLPSVGLLAN